MRTRPESTALTQIRANRDCDMCGKMLADQVDQMRQQIEPWLEQIADLRELADGEGTEPLFTLASHGFVQGDMIYKTATSWAKAQADSQSTLAHVIVTAVPNGNQFRTATGGLVTWYSHGKTVGSQYYLSAATAGATTTTEPTSTDYSQPVYIPITEDTLLVNIGRGVVV